MFDPSDADWSAARYRGLATTRWSMVLAAVVPNKGDDRGALESLCQVYWFPVFAFLRRQGCTTTDAQDLTQDFFAALIEKQFLSAANPAKGRFRSYLLKAVQNFLHNYQAKERAVKRGGGKRLLSIDTNADEERYQLAAARETPAELLFERQWALAVLGQSLANLRESYLRAGKTLLFETLKPHLIASPDALPYAEIAGTLSMSESAVKMAIVRLRRRYRAALLDTIAKTLDEGENIEDELASLLKAVRG